jgi:hypothetical protein
MGEVPLARLWHLSDGTFCLLVKDSRAGNWQARVIRANETLRSEAFGSPIVAMEVAKRWRALYDRSVQAAS